MEKVNEKIVVNIENYSGEKPIEIVYREGEAAQAANPLPTQAPIKAELSGIIDTPLRWLEKRVGTFEQKRARVIVDREALSILLVVNEDDNYTVGRIQGNIELSKTFDKLGINNDSRGWEPNRLGKFFRINRAIFPDREQNMALVAALTNFRAKAQNEIEKQKDPNGSRADVFRSQVQSNLPKSFMIEISIFKGTPKLAMEVEFDHYLSNGECVLLLVAPCISDIINEYRDKAIDEVLEGIRNIAPDIAILEK